ncbi:hypothetical protein GCM10008085_26460 [Winogradskyella epiphytica]|nr:hypothetical protein GCM10008085_26460 [Winogradskyella epiphytica]
MNFIIVVMYIRIHAIASTFPFAEVFIASKPEMNYNYNYGEARNAKFQNELLNGIGHEYYLNFFLIR